PNSVIARVPLQPPLTACQKRSRPTPNGDTTPMPVITIREALAPCMTHYSSAGMARAFLWLGGAVFVAALLTCMWWYLFVLGRSPATVSMPALALDSALFTLFALHHSLFARDPVKRLFGSVPAQAVRSVYVYVASLLLIAVC